MTDTRQLEVFLTLAEELHFGRTAERLHLTQPQVSRALAALERNLGAPLFERTSRRARLTPLGRQFFTEVEPAYRLLRNALDSARAEAGRTSGTLRIGMLLPTGGEPLNRLIRTYEARHPDSRIALSEVSYIGLYEPLRRDEIDVLVSYLILDRHESDLTAGPAIAHAGRVLVVAAADPLAARDSVSIEDLAGRRTAAPLPRFPRAIFDHFAPPATPSGRPIHRTYDLGEHDTYVVATAAAARGHIVHPSVDAYTKQLAHRHDLRLIPIHDLPAVPIGPVWVTARENARIRAFAKTAASLSPSADAAPPSRPDS